MVLQVLIGLETIKISSMRYIYLFCFLIGIIFIIFTSCKSEGNYPGTEYAPQMYHSIPYEPLSQIVQAPDNIIGSWYYIPNSTPYNDYNGKQFINMRRPVEGTIPRQHFFLSTGKGMHDDSTQFLLHYDLHKDSIIQSNELKNPMPDTPEILAEGKELYTAYCSHCHGKKGDGQGKVGLIYGGVVNYKSRSAQNWTEGYIFHVITHGIRRMWPHSSQINPVERWKIVRYVQRLQKEVN